MFTCNALVSSNDPRLCCNSIAEEFHGKHFVNSESVWVLSFDKNSILQLLQDNFFLLTAEKIIFH